jgi:1-deoxy-D-xylulose 5-phosphate reductoisomerase
VLAAARGKHSAGRHRAADEVLVARFLQEIGFHDIADGLAETLDRWRSGAGRSRMARCISLAADRWARTVRGLSLG